MYGFHKVSEYRDQMDQDIWSFKHNSFYRGGKHMLHLIRRKRVSNTGNDSSSTSMMMKTTSLPEIEEDDNSPENTNPTEPIPIEMQLKLKRIEAVMSNTQNQFNMMETELSKLRYIFQEQQKVNIYIYIYIS